MGVKFVDASSKICLRRPRWEQRRSRRCSQRQVRAHSRLARAALSTGAARELVADSGTGTAMTEAAKTRAMTEASERKSILKIGKECGCRLDEC